ncbi:MAG: FAD-binding domain-containing protein [Pseudomonadota bacterium]
MTFVPTREHARAQLASFVPKAGRHYAAERNVDAGRGEHGAVSTLSPYVRTRLITEAEIVAAVLEQHTSRGAEKFIQEVCWRTYWKGWLEQRPAIWRRYTREVRRLTANPAAEHEAPLAAVRNAATGIDCFDAWTRELIETGYLHNHARMWYASIWLFTLRLPWHSGADFFLEHLLDGDAASNTLSWRWVGGLQTRGKTYLATPANITKNTSGRFGRITGLADAAPPLPWDDPPTPNSDFRVRLPDRSLRTGLIVTDDDLSPWPAVSGIESIAAAAIVDTRTWRSPRGVSALVGEFIDGALADAAAAVRQRLRVEPARFAGAELIDACVEWATTADLQQVVVPYLPTGPSADALAALPQRLSDAGIRYANPLRAWDEAAWPHATKGFFPFKKHIPDLLPLAQSVADPI